MKLFRASLLVPWIALGLLARVALRPGESLSLRSQEPSPTAPAAALCGSHGCGCPHEEVPASCCCAGDAPDVPRLVVRIATMPRSPAVLVARAIALPESTVASLSCSGAKPGGATAPTSVASAALPARVLVLAGDDGRSWTPRSEPGPLFDLGTEPSTPPPRRATRA